MLDYLLKIMIGGILFVFVYEINKSVTNQVTFLPNKIGFNQITQFLGLTNFTKACSLK